MTWQYFLIVTFLPLLLYGDASIIGSVVNASRDSAAVPSLLVSLQKIYAGDSAPRQLDERLSASDGVVRFSVTTPDTAAFFLAADYQGVRYFSAGLQLTTGAVEQQTITVHDTTHSSAGVEALMHHILIDDLGDALQLRETRVLSNPTSKTITGVFVDPSEGGLFKFRLPKSAVDFMPLSSPIDEELVQSGEFVIDRGVFIPGNKTIAYAYQLPLSKTLQTAFTVTHAARMFDLFVNANALRLESPLLSDMGEFTIRSMAYRRYSAANVPADSEISVAFIRTKTASAHTSPAVVFLVSGLLLAAGLAVGLYKKSLQVEKSNGKTLFQRKKALISKIAEIEKSGQDATTRNLLFAELKSVELELAQLAKKFGRKR